MPCSSSNNPYPDAKCEPLGLNVTAKTHELWPEKVATTEPCATSHSFMCPSSEAVSSSCESAENAKERIGMAWAAWIQDGLERRRGGGVRRRICIGRVVMVIYV